MEAALAPYVPDLLRSWPQDLAWQQLEGTMVSADISGFTTLAERLAERGREGAEELNALDPRLLRGDDRALRPTRRRRRQVRRRRAARVVRRRRPRHPRLPGCRRACVARSAGGARRPTAGSSAWPCRSACTPGSTTSSPSTPAATTSSSAARGRRRRWPPSRRRLPARSCSATRPRCWFRRRGWAPPGPTGVTLQRLTAARRRPPPPADTDIAPARPSVGVRLRGATGAGRWPAPSTSTARSRSASSPSAGPTS